MLGAIACNLGHRRHCLFLYNLCMYVCMYARLYVCVHVCVCVWVCVCRCIRIFVCVHMYTQKMRTTIIVISNS